MNLILDNAKTHRWGARGPRAVVGSDGYGTRTSTALGARAAIIRPELCALSLFTAFLGCTAPQAPKANAPEPVQSWAAPPLERVLSARDGRTGEEIALEELFDRLAHADVVFLGETHIDETTHRLELATYQALLARRAGRVVLALEFFERDVQPTLDAYLAAAASTG